MELENIDNQDITEVGEKVYIFPFVINILFRFNSKDLIKNYSLLF
jgi:hypothetical protein